MKIPTKQDIEQCCATNVAVYSSDGPGLTLKLFHVLSVITFMVEDETNYFDGYGRITDIFIQQTAETAPYHMRTVFDMTIYSINMIDLRQHLINIGGSIATGCTDIMVCMTTSGKPILAYF